MMDLFNQTPEQQAANLARAQAARAAKAEARRTSPLRRDFLDMPEWERMAQRVSVRLAPQGEPCGTAKMERFLRAVGRNAAWYRTETGETTLSQFAAMNPTYPLRAWCGIVLEMVAREEPARFAGEPS